MPQRPPHADERPARWPRFAGVALVLAALGAAVVLGWRWHRSIPVRQVVVEGVTRATPSAVRDLARVDTGQALYALRLRRVADRAERHPWVRHAAASRSTDGTLRLRVAERTPAALVVQGDSASYYLDAAGYPLPLLAAGHAAFDVPLVRGLDEDFQPLRPTAHAALRRLLAALDEHADASVLVSEIRAAGAKGALELRTLPAGPARQSVAVHLGTGAFAEKLRRLAAFWQQAVEEQPRTAFREVDLRFEGQIVVQQETRSPTAPTD